MSNKFYFSGGVCKSTNRLDGKIAIVTGANTGIGFETALDFAKRGAHVVMACRDVKKAENPAQKIINFSGNQMVNVEHLDLSDFESIRSFSKVISDKFEKIDILVNNAGK